MTDSPNLALPFIEGGELLPDVTLNEALRLIDSEPVLSAELLALGKWISGYYCAPLGEVLRGMVPLASEIRQGKVWSLTDSGRDAARQLLLGSAPDDPVMQILRMLEKRPLPRCRECSWNILGHEAVIRAHLQPGADACRST